MWPLKQSAHVLSTGHGGGGKKAHNQVVAHGSPKLYALAQIAGIEAG